MGPTKRNDKYSGFALLLLSGLNPGVESLAALLSFLPRGSARGLNEFGV